MENVISSLTTALLPIENINVRLQAGLFAGAVYREVSTSKRWNSLKFWERGSMLYINQHTPEGKIDPIFEQLEEYIMDKHVQVCHQVNLIPKKGEMVFSLRDQMGSIQETYKEKEVEIYVSKGEKEDKKTSGLQIIVKSAHLSLEDLKTYVANICHLEKTYHSTITVYRSLVHKSNKRDANSQVEWDKLFMKTNKTLKNTVYSKKVCKDLFDDVAWFMKNEDWFTQRGIPYKRGYLLYGDPGVGKTSIAKILANMYNLPIFVLDMPSIHTNSEFTKLITEINYLTDKRYIVSIEDIDRTPMFKDRWYNQNGEQLSMQNFMNFLDGIVETHGRIILFTANDLEGMEANLKDQDKHEAVFRPGRIDAKIEIKTCDTYQISKLYEIFYNQPLPESEIQLKTSVSPAYMVNFLSKLTAEEAKRILTGQPKDTLVSSTTEKDNPLQAAHNLLGLTDLQHGCGKSKRGTTRRGSRRQFQHRKATPEQMIQRKTKALQKIETSVLGFLRQADRLKDEIENRHEKLEKQKEIYIMKAQEKKRKTRARTCHKKRKQPSILTSLSPSPPPPVLSNDSESSSQEGLQKSSSSSSSTTVDPFSELRRSKRLKVGG